MRDIIIVDGVPLAPPSSYSYSKEDLYSPSTGRVETGLLHSERIREGVYKIELTWTGRNSSEVHNIETVIRGKSFKVQFPTAGGYITKHMYAGPIKIDPLKFNVDTEKAKWDVSLNFIEI